MASYNMRLRKGWENYLLLNNKAPVIQGLNYFCWRCGRDSNRIFISHIIILTKYQNISDLLDKSDLSVRRIAGITGHSANTVLKIKQLKEI
jgi:hypothetical protein